MCYFYNKTHLIKMLQHLLSWLWEAGLARACRRGCWLSGHSPQLPPRAALGSHGPCSGRKGGASRQKRAGCLRWVGRRTDCVQLGLALWVVTGREPGQGTAPQVQWWTAGGPLSLPECPSVFCHCLPLGTCCSCWKGSLRWGRVEASCWTFRAGEKVAVFAATDQT